MPKFFILVCYKKYNFILFVLVLILINFFSINFTTELEVLNYTCAFPKNNSIIRDGNNQNTKELLESNDIVYHIIANPYMSIDPENNEYIDHIKISDFFFNKEISSDAVDDISYLYSKSINTISYSLETLNQNHIIDGNKYNIEYQEIQNLIIGSLPKNVNEIVIDESYAQKLIYDNSDFEIYKDLINFKIIVDSNPYVIKGIYKSKNYDESQIIYKGSSKKTPDFALDLLVFENKNGLLNIGIVENDIISNEQICKHDKMSGIIIYVFLKYIIILIFTLINSLKFFNIAKNHAVKIITIIINKLIFIILICLVDILSILITLSIFT